MGRVALFFSPLFLPKLEEVQSCFHCGAHSSLYYQFAEKPCALQRNMWCQLPFLITLQFTSLAWTDISWWETRHVWLVVALLTGKGWWCAIRCHAAQLKPSLPRWASRSPNHMTATQSDQNHQIIVQSPSHMTVTVITSIIDHKHQMTSQLSSHSAIVEIASQSH